MFSFDFPSHNMPSLSVTLQLRAREVVPTPHQEGARIAYLE